jgi:ribosomal protein L16/L10AE
MKKTTQKIKITKRHKNRKQQRTVVIHPKHRVKSHGVWSKWASSYKVCIKSLGHGEITQSQQKAFLKSLKSKSIRRIFRFRGSPFVDLTKKPAEVRMGKGRGTRINKTIFPLAPGQCFAELDVSHKPLRIKALAMWFKKASHKLSRRVKTVTLDL